MENEIMKFKCNLLASVISLAAAALPLPSAAGKNDAIAVTATGGCKVWMPESTNRRKTKVSWSGACDAQGFASGEGKLFRDFGDSSVDAFIGQMREGEIFSGKYYYDLMDQCLPKQHSGTMTFAEAVAWHTSNLDKMRLPPKDGRYPCRANDKWFIWEWKKVNGKTVDHETDGRVYIGIDAERIAEQTGIPAFAAAVRSHAPPGAAAMRRASSGTSLAAAPASSKDDDPKTVGGAYRRPTKN